MNAVVTLTRTSRRARPPVPAPERSALPIALVTPLGGAVLASAPAPDDAYPPASLDRVIRNAPGDAPDAAVIVAAKLRAASPDLLDRAGPAGELRLRDAALSRIATLVDRSVQSFRTRIGTVAAHLVCDQRIRLQDLALTLHLRTDALSGHVAAGLSCAETLALLASTHEPVLEDADVPAREAALDLLRSDLEGTSHPVSDDIVAAQLLDAILAEPGLTAGTREALHAHFTDARPPAAPPARSIGGNETLFLSEIEAGRNHVAVGLLSAAAEIPEAAIRRQLSLRNAHALVSLVWRAGFGAATAIAAQVDLGGIAPEEILAADADGFPLEPAEMGWQCKAMSLAAPTFAAAW